MIARAFHSSIIFNCFLIFFFFNDTATTEIYTLSLHDALPISPFSEPALFARASSWVPPLRSSECYKTLLAARSTRSEEHTSELQSPCNLVCRLLLEKKKKKIKTTSKSLAHQADCSLRVVV